ncbi:MAG: HlyD family secretion protein [Polyangiales bacterium]
MSDEAPKPPKSPKRFLPLILLIGGVCAYFGHERWQARQPYEWSGTVEAHVSHVGSRVGGRVRELKINEGDAVKKGQPLVVIEEGDLPAQRLVAVGTLEQAKANLDRLERGARPEEIEQAKARAAAMGAALAEAAAGPRIEEIDAASARLAQAEATLAQALIDRDRTRKLLDTGAATQADVDTVDSRTKEATSARDAAKATYDELKKGTRKEQIAQAAAVASEARAGAKLIEAGSRVEDIAQARAMVKIAQGHLDQIDVALKELTITAPEDARVETLDLRVGDILSPNGVALTLVAAGDLFVRIYVPETVIAKVKVGDDVALSVDSFPNETFTGHVVHINDVGEYTPRNLQTADERADQVFAIRIDLGADAGARLRAGMAAFLHRPKTP